LVVRRAEYQALVREFETFAARLGRERCVDNFFREGKRLAADSRYTEAAFAFETALIAARDIAREDGVQVAECDEAFH
jgi:hypothetical protein